MITSLDLALAIGAMEFKISAANETVGLSTVRFVYVHDQRSCLVFKSPCRDEKTIVASDLRLLLTVMGVHAEKGERAIEHVRNNKERLPNLFTNHVPARWFDVVVAYLWAQHGVETCE